MKTKPVQPVLNATRRITSLARPHRSPILRSAVVLLVALAWGTLAFCGEIHDAARDGDLARVKALLIQSPDLASSTDDNGATPLHWAAMKGHTEVVKLLLTYHSPVNARDVHEGRTPLHYAAANGYKDVAIVLLASKADVTLGD